MDSVAAILRGPWTGLAAYPESVPHLLHWDLAYLWILRKEAALRPQVWNQRVTAWKKLLALFLLGIAKPEQEDIPVPLLSYTSRFGITSITKLIVNGSCVGVLSPVVVVRPLPDLDDEQLAALPGIPAERRDELAYFVRLLRNQIEALAGQEGNRPLQTELRQLICSAATEFAAAPVAAAAGAGFGGVGGGGIVNVSAQEQEGPVWEAVPVRFSLLRSISFHHQDVAASGFDPVEFQVSTGRRAPLFIPRCRICNRSLLTADQGALNITVTGETIPLTCRDGHANAIQLEQLMIWPRHLESGSNEVVVWTNRQGWPFPDETEAKYPPPAQVEGNTVQFVWNTVAIDGRLGRTLRLSFPNHALRPVSARDQVFYSRPLAPGPTLSGYQGLPVRGEWMDCVAQFHVQPQDSSLVYRLKLRGWPFPIRLTYATNSVVRDDQVGFAIYPKPMHAGWRKYRLLTLGPRARAYRSWTPGANGYLPDVKEVTQWPRVVSLETEDGTAGASWRTEDWAPAETTQAPAGRLCLGVDFGTSNTVLYFQTKGETSDLTSQKNAVAWSSFRQLLHWIHEPASELDAGWFLPASQTPQADPYLLPSALWHHRQRDLAFIRWSSSAPLMEGFEAEHGFKWDRDLQDLSRLRRSYLSELFFFALPAILERQRARGVPVGLDIGFAYPLAFSYSQRAAYRTMIDDLRSQLRNFAGLEAETFSINESLATVRARGAFNPGEICLVADMGGRTLDIALFTYQANAEMQICPEFMHQIGSIDFGGEIFLGAVAKRRAQGGGAAEFESAYWRLRDSVVTERASQIYGQDAAIGRLLDRFQPMALEFLRVLLCAFRANSGDSRPIRVFLTGNGWRLRDLRAGRQDPAQFSLGHFRRLLGEFGLANLELSSSHISGIQSSKHWVACGALQAVTTTGGDELTHGQPFPSRMAAGITIRFTGVNGAQSWPEISWKDPVGEGGWSCPGPSGGIDHQTVDFDYNSIPKPASGWSGHLDQAVPAGRRFPAPETLRAALRKAFENGRFTKGPLTLVVENHWKGLLSE